MHSQCVDAPKAALTEGARKRSFAGVGSRVLAQLAAPAKDQAACVALVRFVDGQIEVLVVDVLAQIVRLGKVQAATVAFVWSDFGVNAATVRLQRGVLPELSATLAALVGHLAGVYSHVFAEIGEVLERFAALLTGAPVDGVLLEVRTQIGVPLEGAAASVARERLVDVISVHVLVHFDAGAEAIAAQVALQLELMVDVL